MWDTSILDKQFLNVYPIAWSSFHLLRASSETATRSTILSIFDDGSIVQKIVVVYVCIVFQ